VSLRSAARLRYRSRVKEQRNLAAAWGQIWRSPRAVQLRRWALRLFAVGLLLALGAATVEEVAERRARARFTAGETFADVNGAKVRYRMLGTEHSGPTVVLLPGLGGSIEQMQHLHPRLAKVARTLTYDRGGYGFSVDSNAHSAAEQATELEGLLRALSINGPLVVVGYSSSSMIARIYAGRHPERVAALFHIEPEVPELEARRPGEKSARRIYLRWIVHDLVTTTFGIKRFGGAAPPNVLAEQRAAEVLQSRRHMWALAREWFVIPETFAQTLRAPVGKQPFVILFTEQHDPGPALLEGIYHELVARSPRGKVIKLPSYDHARLLMPGPVLDAIVSGIDELVKSAGPQ
jgi:pimeloyl-ACP methyl ester carboxylesterase